MWNLSKTIKKNLRLHYNTHIEKAENIQLNDIKSQTPMKEVLLITLSKYKPSPSPLRVTTNLL